MADENKLLFEVAPDLKRLAKSFEQIVKMSEGAGEEAGSAVGRGMSVGSVPGLNKLKVAALAAIGVFASAQGLRKMIDEATESENSVNRLSRAMANAGTYSESASASFQGFADKLQMSTGIADDVITSNAAMLVSLGKLSGDGLERATKAALDLSVGMDKDLGSTFQALSRAAANGGEGLSKFGVKVDETLPKSERFAAALKTIEANFGGAAAGNMDTFSGALNKIGLGFNKIFEESGKLITQSPVVRDLIKFLADQFFKAGSAIEAFGKSGDFVGNVVKQVLNIAQAMTQYVIPVIELFVRGSITLFHSLRAAITEMIIVPLTGIVGVIGTLGNMVGIVSDETATKLAGAFDSAKQKALEFTQAEQASMASMFNFDASLASSEFVAKLQQVADAAVPVTTAFKNAVVANMTEIDKKSVETAKKLGQILQQGFVNTISTSVAALGASLVKGGDAFKEFQKTMMNMLGDMAIQMGATMVLAGLGINFEKVFDGTGAIAAGLGLIALGGVLKAMSGGGGGEATPAVTHPNGDRGGPSGSVDTTSGGVGVDVDNMEKTRPGSEIIVQVNGNIFNGREQAQVIAEGLNEWFGTNSGALIRT